ncbi:MAG: hypothetical protein A4E62_02817 [Syntrophorhabdus sp. PtaU1.Bin002]|nr:MAG: hypothetical protein A4E62_02817 [Syntrophorhabdus sp. PtaU1.Bin002]
MTVLISAGVSIVTVLLSFLLKAWFERYFLIFKLEAEHRYEQKKKIKEVIAKNKTSLLDAAESLNHRLWNFSKNYEKGWHKLSGKLVPDSHYYLASFAYRILSFYAWVRRVEIQMVYLDATVASRDDLNFLKFLRLFEQTMCDTVLFEGLKYNSFYSRDHFFKNNFVHMCECFWKNDEIMSYADFKSNTAGCLEEAEPMVDFLSGMNPEESRLRWDRLQALHYVLLMFLNSYGYEFQRTSIDKIKSLLDSAPRQNKTIRNMESMIEEMSLGKHSEVKRVLETLQKL